MFDSNVVNNINTLNLTEKEMEKMKWDTLIQKKLYKIKLNKDNSYVLIDFDRTITNGDSFSAWRVLYYSDLLGDNFKKEYDKIHDNTKPDKNTSIEFKVLSYEKRFKQFMKLLENCNYSESINKQAV